jgi:hypothetical protein
VLMVKNKKIWVLLMLVLLGVLGIVYMFDTDDSKTVTREPETAEYPVQKSVHGMNLDVVLE